jgi:hypothetical protein
MFYMRTGELFFIRIEHLENKVTKLDGLSWFKRTSLLPFEMVWTLLSFCTMADGHHNYLECHLHLPFASS